MNKQILCVRVCVCVCVCMCISSTQQGVAAAQLHVPGERPALAAQMQVAESPGWEVVMYNESCLALLLRETVKLPSSISFIIELQLSRTQGLYQDIASTTGSSQMHSSHNYSSELKSLLPVLSKIEGSVSPALDPFLPSVVHSPLLKEIKSR